MKKNQSWEYRHPTDPGLEPDQRKDDFYISVDADVSRPDEGRFNSQFPRIKQPRFINNPETFTIDARRQRHNLTMAKAKQKLKLPSHLSNLSIFSNKGTNSRLEIAREKENKSLSYLIQNKIQQNGPSVLPANLGMSPLENRASKKTLPINPRVNMMMKNDSTIMVPQSLLSHRTFDKYVIFSDIEIYLKKLKRKYK